MSSEGRRFQRTTRGDHGLQEIKRDSVPGFAGRAEIKIRWEHGEAS